MPRKETTGAQITAESQQHAISDGIDNFELPKSLVAKIAKATLPEHAKLQKEAGLALVKGSSVFINFLAATAHEVATSKQHKSVSASDVVRALELIEFGDIIPRLQAELQVYRDIQKSSRKSGGASGGGVGGKSKAPAEVVITESTGSAVPLHPTASTSKPKPKENTETGAVVPAPQNDEDEDERDRDNEDEEEDTQQGQLHPDQEYMDVDNDVVDEEPLEEEVVEEFDPAEEQVEEDDEEGGEEQELVDQVAIEEEELLKDTRGLDQHAPPEFNADAEA